MIPNAFKHGHSGSSTYATWSHMKRRCSDRTLKAYPDYGGRGVAVCDRWLGTSGFVNFLADMGERPAGMTIDRINNDGNYEKSNCRWSSKTQQARNRRSSKLEPHEPAQIRWLRSEGYRLKEIAAFFDISMAMVSYIATGQSWRSE